MACNLQKFVGRDVVLEYAIGCPDTLPLPGEWKQLGSMRTKDMTLEWETTDATADDSIGSLRENLATFQSFSVSGDGVVKASGTGAQNLIDLTKHVANPTSTNGQPFIWARLTFVDLTFTCFMIVSNMSRSAPFDDVVTYTFEASATASDFGLLVEDTPDPDAPEVESVTVTPATDSIAVGATTTLTATVLPAEAPQGVVWSSDDTDVATVDSSGVVTGVSPGTCTITATSTSDPSKTGESEITVTSE